MCNHGVKIPSWGKFDQNRVSVSDAIEIHEILYNVNVFYINYVMSFLHENDLYTKLCRGFGSMFNNMLIIIVYLRK